jgi:hypothetical protein
MRRSRAPSNWPGPFFAARSWAGCTTNMFGIDLRQAQVQEQWLFGGFQSGYNVALPLILPGRVLPGNGEVRDIFPHLDEAQLD